jgi:ATP phosphoribosyltransferase
MNKLILGLPKGSLQETTFDLFSRAGFNIRSGQRSYLPTVDDQELDIRLIRAQEMSRYVESGMLDIGITGHDWVVENGSDVHEVSEMVYGKVGRRPIRWVLAVHEDSPVQSVKDLEGKTIATEAVGMTERYLAKHNVTAEVEFSWGATEVKCPQLVDAIVELTETGNSLVANNLRIVDTLMESTTRMVVNHNAWKDDWKRAKIEQINMLLQGALQAEGKVLLKLNVAAEGLPDVIKSLPALHSPTINKLTDDGWHSVESVVDQKDVRDIIPKLKAAGADGILEVAINKIVP